MEHTICRMYVISFGCGDGYIPQRRGCFILCAVRWWLSTEDAHDMVRVDRRTQIIPLPQHLSSPFIATGNRVHVIMPEAVYWQNRCKHKIYRRSNSKCLHLRRYIGSVHGHTFPMQQTPRCRISNAFDFWGRKWPRKQRQIGCGADAVTIEIDCRMRDCPFITSALK